MSGHEFAMRSSGPANTAAFCQPIDPINPGLAISCHFTMANQNAKRKAVKFGDDHDRIDTKENRDMLTRVSLPGMSQVSSPGSRMLCFQTDPARYEATLCWALDQAAAPSPICECPSIPWSRSGSGGKHTEFDAVGIFLL